jgi:transposase
MILNTHSSQELKALSNKVKDHRMRLRLLAVSHFKSGKNRAEIARMLNISRRIVNTWVGNYLNKGISALESKKQTGRPSYLSDKEKQTLSLYIKAQSQSETGGRLTGESIQTYINANFGIDYHPNAIYKLLKSIGFSWITSRSRHPKQSDEVQEAFKKIRNANDPDDPVEC